MIKKIRLDSIECYYGQSRFDELDKEYIDMLRRTGKYCDRPIILCQDNLPNTEYLIVDGHHRYMAAKLNFNTHIDAIILNTTFKKSEKLRDFQKHLKGMVPEDYDPKNLKDEFEEVLKWLVLHLEK